MRPSLKKSLLPVLLSLFGTLVVLFPSNPTNMTLPSRDSGVFLYVGWRLLKGDIPYRDVWDHKPPLIYFVDALGLLLNPQSLLGVWILQFCFLFLTILFLYNSLNESLGTIPAVVGMIVLTSGLLTILDQGNVTEEYALVFQTLGFWLFVKSHKKDYPLRHIFWIGVCGGLAFYFKQTTIGIWIAFAIFLFLMRILQKKSPFIDLLILMSGWGLFSIILVLVFTSQHALNDFWNEAFLYNFVYVGKHEAFSRLIPVILKGFLFLSQGAVLYLAVLGWLISLVFIWLNRKSVLTIQPLILLSLINFPIEIILITFSGRSILHYYLTPLPVMAILSGFLVYSLGPAAGRFIRVSSPRAMKSISILALLAVLVLQIDQVQNYPVYIGNVADNTYAPVISYVTENTKTDDKVLVLGAESVVNFLTRREAPTRYVYQYPLLLLGNRGMYNEFFQQIIHNKPVLIIDAPGGYQFDENIYKPMQIRSTIVSNGVQYLLNNYQRVATFGDWIIYRLKEGS